MMTDMEKLIEENKKLYNFVDNITGFNEEAINEIDRSKRIKIRNRLEKIRTNIKKYKDNINKIIFSENKNSIKSGITADGKKFIWYTNDGITERSLFCGTLYIDGKLIFTSGTIEKALPYLCGVEK